MFLPTHLAKYTSPFVIIREVTPLKDMLEDFFCFISSDFLKFTGYDCKKCAMNFVMNLIIQWMKPWMMSCKISVEKLIHRFVSFLYFFLASSSFFVDFEKLSKACMTFKILIWVNLLNLTIRLVK